MGGGALVHVFIGGQFFGIYGGIELVLMRLANFGDEAGSPAVAEKAKDGFERDQNATLPGKGGRLWHTKLRWLPRE